MGCNQGRPQGLAQGSSDSKHSAGGQDACTLLVAKEATTKPVEAAADMAVVIWRGEQLADAEEAAEATAKQAEKAFEKALLRTMMRIKSAEKALRQGVHEAKVVFEEEMEDLVWTMDSIVEEVPDDMQEAHDTILGHIEAWQDMFISDTKAN
mmetsp:Transcript_127360/g.354559  ORF Transcript_127360/g.354559 Transcript_127360/m.354559 type:complete len:152 (-) Transcript_127360:457-912(-)